MMEAADDDADVSSPQLPDLFRTQEVARFLDLVGFTKRDRQQEPLKHAELEVSIHSRDSRNDFPFRTSNNTVLSALAQLGVIRLRAARAIISLLDSSTQYILTEAVPSWLTDPNATGPTENIGIYLGCGNLPRKDGFCELVLDPSNIPSDGVLTSSGTVILTNLRSSQRTSEKRFLEHNGIYQFYAGAPIRSQTGIIIGAYCIFCIKQRSGLSDEEEHILQDLAKAVSNQLETLHAQSEAQRRSELIAGLHLFNNGLNVPADLAYWSHADMEVQEQCYKTEVCSTLESDKSRDALPSFFQTQNPPSGTPVKTLQAFVNHEEPDGDQLSNGAKELWQRALPDGTLKMFTRAARVLRFSTNYDGVAFLHMASDQMVPFTTSRGPSTSHIVRSISQETVDQLSTCQVLGTALRGDSDMETDDRFEDFTMRDLYHIIGQRRPQAKTISVMSARDRGHSRSGPLDIAIEKQADDEQIVTSNDGGIQNNFTGKGPKRAQSSRIKALQKLDQDARHFIALPLWDHERQRWFATCICWTAGPKRTEELAEDLGFLRTFGNSVMASLSRLDAETSLRKKQTFVSSISHELRSPLHGIMGSLDMLRDTDSKRSQQVYVDAIASCSRTLLDTLDHVIDYAGIASTETKVSSLDSTNGRRSSRIRSTPEEQPIVNIAELAEEVAEALWLGNQQRNIDVADLESNRGGQRPDLKRQGSFHLAGRSDSVVFGLGISHRSSWYVYSRSTPLRRLLTIIVGNALKFTVSGYIVMELATDQDVTGMSVLKIVVKDTGCGMSPEYLNNYLFRPFSQEDPLASGAGLGLSIAKSIVDDVEGSITVSSQISQGTTVNISMPITMCTDTIQPSLDWLAAVRSRTIAQNAAIFSGRTTNPGTDDILNAGKELQLQYMARMVKEWLACTVTVSSVEDAKQADIIIFLEPNFEILEQIERAAQTPRDISVLIVAHDLVELSALRPDVRVRSSQMRIDFLVQPIGPRKLGLALQRLWESPKSPWSASFPSNVMASLALESIRTDQRLESSPKSQDVMAPLSTALPSVPVRRVLIVDDNPINLRLLGTFLKKQSIPFLEAKNGKEAVEVYMQQYMEIFLVLMDISMPVMTGTTATQHIRSFEVSCSSPRVPVVAVTGLVNDSARADAEAAGMDEYMTKPLSFKAVAGVVQRYSADSRP